MAKETLPEARKLEKLLLELFQFDDAAKLDFGIYRILAQNQKELRAFLRELIEGVPTKLAETAGGERERLAADLATYERRRLDDGDDLDEIRLSKGYKERSDKVKAAVDVGELAREVFRDLYVFFKRYWDDGDFIAAPRYSKDQYAIPYDGAEVALHWANKDQYYVKSSLFFSDMAVKLGDGRLKVVLVSAVADRDNVKAADNKSRRFTLADGEDAVRAEGTDLIVQLKYGAAETASEADPAAAAGGDDLVDADVAEEPATTDGDKRAKTPRQDKIDEATAAAIVARAPKEWKHWLGAPDNEGKSEMYRRLRRYTKGNSADFFIHKNLRKFLRRELDFFIKNEVFDLDNIDGADLVTLDAKLKRVKALRVLAHDLIDWLHQVEEFQRRLFLKKKLVLQTDWVVTLDRVPRELWAEIGSNADQVAEWKELYGIADIPKDLVNGSGGAGTVVDTRFLNANSCLAVSVATIARSNPALASKLLSHLDASKVTGTMICSEGSQALNLLDASLSGDVATSFIDPPYNTGNDDFIYKDGYSHSTWLSMMAAVLENVRQLLSDSGVLWCTLDGSESPRFWLQASDSFGSSNFMGHIVWQHSVQTKGYAGKLAVGHNNVFGFSRSADFSLGVLERTDEHNKYYSNPDNDPKGAWRTGYLVNSMYRPNLVYEVKAPGGGIIKPPEIGWRYSSETMQAKIKSGEIFFSEDETRLIRKIYLADQEGHIPNSIWLGSDAGTSRSANLLLKSMIPGCEFGTAKPPELIQRLLTLSMGEDDTALDCFAGSGTTGHAVINLNREDGGSRKFVLVEMGGHFETVLVPRILKATYSKDWKDGKPMDRKGMSALYKIIRLESYDDTLENIELRRPDDRQQQLGGGIRKDYLLRYMLNMEASKSMLDLERFRTPFDYKIRALVTHREESGRSWSNVEEAPVDLVETFNYLLGLRVKTVQPLGKGGDMRVARYVEGVRRDAQGAWVIKTLVVWRDATKVDDAKLDEMFDTAQFTEKRLDGSRYIADFDEVYVNGDNRLPNLRLDGERWKVTLIESAFHELMFDIPDEE